MKRRNAQTVAAVCGMGILIFCAPEAAAGCREGIELCLHALIPSLFPFFLVSCLLTDSLSGRSIAVLRPVERLCRIPEGSGCLLLTGFLGGYPSGAQSVAQAYQSGRISRADGERMLSFCSNAGPAFLFGMVAPFFDNPLYPWVLWAVHILSALAAGVLIPGNCDHFHPSLDTPCLSPVQAMEKAIKSIASVCSWVVLFRMALGLCEPLLSAFLPEECRIALSGLLELSNGCIRLGGIRQEGLRFFLSSGMLSFGGICVVMQTSSVCAGLSIHKYISGKLLQMGISLVLSAVLQPLFASKERMNLPWPAVALLILPVMLTGIRKTQKNKGSIPGMIGV